MIGRCGGIWQTLPPPWMTDWLCSEEGLGFRELNSAEPTPSFCNEIGNSAIPILLPSLCVEILHCGGYTSDSCRLLDKTHVVARDGVNCV